MEETAFEVTSVYGNDRCTDGEKIYRYGNSIVNGNGGEITPAGLMRILGDDVYHSLQSAQRTFRVGKNLLIWGWITFVFGLLLIVFSVPLAVETEIGFLLIYMLGIIIFSLSNVMRPAGYVLKGVSAGRISRIAERYNKEHPEAQ